MEIRFLTLADTRPLDLVLHTPGPAVTVAETIADWSVSEIERDDVFIPPNWWVVKDAKGDIVACYRPTADTAAIGLAIITLGENP